jgi:hypothetical protein
VQHESKRLKNLVGKIKALNFKSTNTTHIQFIDICQFEGEQYLASSNKEKRTRVFSKDNLAIKEITRLNSKEFAPFGLTTNNSDRVYITDKLNYTESS